MNPRHFLATLSSALMLAFGGVSPAQAQTVTIGVSVSSTGPAPSLGIAQKNTIELLPKTLGGLPVNYVVLAAGPSLGASQYPGFFAALDGEGAIVADAPYLHPATSEFAADYLPQHNISAILATPIHIRGELQGVFCLEQVGGRQPWSTMHRVFAQAIANLVTLALVEYEASEARRQARTASERLQAVFNASREAMLLADGDTGIVLDANRQAELLFGIPRTRLIGRHQRQLHPPREAERGSRAFQQTVSGELKGASIGAYSARRRG